MAQVAKPSLNVKIHAPYKVYFDAPAYSVSAVNRTGPFDILPKHHNFMTLLTQGDINIVTETGKQTIKIARGIMHVRADKVTVFLDV